MDKSYKINIIYIVIALVSSVFIYFLVRQKFTLFAAVGLAAIFTFILVEVFTAIYLRRLGKKIERVARNYKAILYQIILSEKQVLQSVKQISESSESQFKQIKDISSFMTEMATAAQQTSFSATKAAENIIQSNKEAQEAGKNSEGSLDNLTNISNIVSGSSSTIKSLSSRSDEIIAVVKFIDNISKQTNLLALNASVEAARAGEAGKGFTVVADEIRKLAEKTATGTKHISELLESIQGQIKNSVDSMNKGSGEVDNSTGVIKQSLVSLKNIAVNSEEVSSHIEEISIAAKQQSSGIDNIISSVNSAVTAAQQNTQKAGQISGNIEKQLTFINKIEDLMVELDSVSIKIKRFIEESSLFKPYHRIKLLLNRKNDLVENIDKLSAKPLNPEISKSKPEGSELKEVLEEEVKDNKPVKSALEEDVNPSKNTKRKVISGKK